MSSLSVHLRFSEDHSGLPFHPSCPVCRRDRLSGSLAGDELVSRRTQAAIAVGLLAFSAVGAPAAVAAGPDEDVEGSVELVESTDPGPADLGDGTLPLTDAGQAAPEDEATEEAAPPESAGDVPVIEEAATQEAAGDVDALVVEVEEDPATPTVYEEPVADAGPAVPPAEAPATAEPEPDGDGPSVDASMGTERVGRSGEQRRTAEPVAHREAAAPVPAGFPTSARALATAKAATATVGVVAGTRTSTSTSTSTSAGNVSAGDRFHVVRRGESLWSIAADLLGDRATVPRIAREVNRLWALNEDRIASGDPDLLYAGTRLTLR